MPAAFAIGAHEADQCQVVGLGGAAGPDDLARVGGDQVGDLTAGVLYRLFRLPAQHMAARSGVGEDAVQGQMALHDLGDAGVDRGGGGIVEIDECAHCLAEFSSLFLCPGDQGEEVRMVLAS